VIDTLIAQLDPPATSLTSQTARSGASCTSSGMTPRRRRGTATVPRSAPGCPGARAPNAGPRRRCSPTASAAPSTPTTPATCPSERSTASSHAARSPCARGRRGGCCMRPPRAPRRSLRWTLSSSTSPTAEHPSAPKAARPNGCTGAPAPRTSYRGCCGYPTGPAAVADPCSSPTASQPPPATPPPRDICPHTGRPRLGYDRARVLLHAYTGWRLHQLRHAAATHLGENKVPLQLIMTKTRHRSPRTAMRYVHPGAAVAEVTELLDPPRRVG
jgi:hypothetical protein